MARLKLRVTAAARSDLLNIGAFTNDRWGADQAVRYLKQLDQRFSALARAPGSGRQRNDVRPGYFSAHEGRHVIFYRVVGDTLEIVRVLHERMLPHL